MATATAESTKMVSAVFRNHSRAHTAYNWLRNQGYSPAEINLLMSDKTRDVWVRSADEEGSVEAGSKAVEGVATGGVIGGAVGATAAAIAAIGTSVAVPGLGMIVAGPLFAGLAGAGAGALAGGAVGGLIGLGIPESNAKAYELALHDGGVVVGVHPHNNEDEKRIKEFFEKNEGDNVITCGK